MRPTRSSDRRRVADPAFEAEQVPLGPPPVSMAGQPIADDTNEGVPIRAEHSGTHSAQTTGQRRHSMWTPPIRHIP